uniref:Heterogeneous nuclear ribonucleoprotein U-like isoform X3 n=1 Tax=Diabrotica virgifera virgifera TaxID=50390 RepID=A0A6P7H0L3_DIAVI
MSSSIEELSKLKVVDLRNELANRGLDQKGVKAVLVKRLKDAMDNEEAGSADTPKENETVEDSKPAEPVRKSRRLSSSDDRANTPEPARKSRRLSSDEKANTTLEDAKSGEPVRKSLRRVSGDEREEARSRRSTAVSEKTKLPVITEKVETPSKRKAAEAPKPATTSPKKPADEKSETPVTPEKGNTDIKPPVSVPAENKVPVAPTTQAKTPEKPAPVNKASVSPTTQAKTPEKPAPVNKAAVLPTTQAKTPEKPAPVTKSPEKLAVSQGAVKVEKPATPVKSPEKPVAKTPDKPAAQKPETVVKVEKPATPVKSPQKPVVKTPEKQTAEVKVEKPTTPVVKSPEKPVTATAKSTEKPATVTQATANKPSAVVSKANDKLSAEKTVKTQEKLQPTPKPPVEIKTEKSAAVPSKLPEKGVAAEKASKKTPETVVIKTQEKLDDALKAIEKKKASKGEEQADDKPDEENGEQADKEIPMEVQEGSKSPARSDIRKSKTYENDKRSHKRRRSSNSPESKRDEKRRRGGSPSRDGRRARSPPKEDEPALDADVVQLSWFDSDLNLEVDKGTFLSAKPLNEGVFSYVWAGARATHGVSNGKVCYEVKITEKLKCDTFELERSHRDYRRERTNKSDSDEKRDERDKSREMKENDTEKDTASENKEASLEKKEESMEVTESENAENKESAADKPPESTDKPKEPKGEENSDEKSKKETDEKSNKETDEKPNKETDEKSNKETDEKSNKETDEKPMEVDEKDDKSSEKSEATVIPTHCVRIGWSLSSSSLQLGEEKHSFGYDSSGKFVTDKKFSDYGVTFDTDAVIGAYLDITESSIILRFSVNGELQPPTEISKSEMPEDFVLYPHIVSRNYAFEVNFGEKAEPWFAVPSELTNYKFISKAENKVSGPTRPEAKSECEVLLMFGLPACGKTHWVNEHVAQNKDKKYTVIGNTTMLERMTVFGEPFKSKYKGKWRILIDRMQRCINRLLSTAPTRRRNYIIDQSNVFASAQSRKMRPFEGFKRKAVVIIVGDEEQTKRQALQEEQEGKEILDSTILGMKANMTLPETGDFIEEICYVSTEENEAKEIVKKYHEEGKAALKDERRDRDRSNYNRNQGRNYQRSGGYNQSYDRRNWQSSRRDDWKYDQRSRDYRGGSYDQRSGGHYGQGGYDRYRSGGRSDWGGNNYSGRGHSGGWNQQTFGGRSHGQSWGSQGYNSNSGQRHGGYGERNWNYHGQSNWNQKK